MRSRRGRGGEERGDGEKGGRQYTTRSRIAALTGCMRYGVVISGVAWSGVVWLYPWTLWPCFVRCSSQSCSDAKRLTRLGKFG